MHLSEITEKNLTDDLIDKLLFGGLEYKGQTADLIFVPGSRKAWLYRVPLAAQLYREGKAPRLLFSGGNVHETEGEKMKEYESMLLSASILALPRDKIITEEQAANTAENMRFSRELISRVIPECRSIILVTTAYHMRRALLLARKEMPEYEIFTAPADKGSTTSTEWKLTKKGITTARAECMKLAEYAAKGYIEDMEIQL